jgi:transcriptional regulator with XRE-family HTH domain
MTYGNRLDQAIKLAKSSRKALGEAIGITEQAIGQVIRGDTEALKAPHSAKAARFLKVDHHWLATSEGEPRPNAGWPFMSFGPSEYFRLSPELRLEIEDRLLGAIVRTSEVKERGGKAA